MRQIREFRSNFEILALPKHGYFIVSQKDAFYKLCVNNNDLAKPKTKK